MRAVNGRKRFARIFGPGAQNKVQFQGASAHPWRLEKRKGLARGLYYRSSADDRFASKQISTEAQYCLNALLISRWRSAYRPVFGLSPADLYGCGVGDGDLSFAPDISAPVLFARQWRLRVMALAAALRGIAKGKLQRLSARDRSFNRADVKVGESALLTRATAARAGGGSGY